MKPSVYIETTIVSYLTCWPSRDLLRLSHELITKEWWSKHRMSFDLYISEFVIGEASRGDPTAAAERLEELKDIPLLPADPATMDLAEKLSHALTLPAHARLDAAHAAV